MKLCGLYCRPHTTLARRAAVDPFCPAQSKPTSPVWKLRFRSLHGQVLGKVPVQEGTL